MRSRRWARLVDLQPWWMAKFDAAARKMCVFSTWVCWTACGFVMVIAFSARALAVRTSKSAVIVVGGRIAALKAPKGHLPSMLDLFVGCSTIFSWLALNDGNVAVVLAPSHRIMSVFVAAIMMYCTDADRWQERGMDMIEWYSRMHVEESTRTRCSVYSGGLPRSEVRLINDFAMLLELRDAALKESTEQVLGGMVAMPMVGPIVVDSISISASHNPPVRVLNVLITCRRSIIDPILSCTIIKRVSCTRVWCMACTLWISTAGRKSMQWTDKCLPETLC